MTTVRVNNHCADRVKVTITVEKNGDVTVAIVPLIGE